MFSFYIEERHSRCQNCVGVKLLGLLNSKNSYTFELIICIYYIVYRYQGLTVLRNYGLVSQIVAKYEKKAGLGRSSNSAGIPSD